MFSVCQSVQEGLPTQQYSVTIRMTCTFRKLLWKHQGPYCAFFPQISPFKFLILKVQYNLLNIFYPWTIKTSSYCQLNTAIHILCWLVQEEEVNTQRYRSMTVEPNSLLNGYVVKCNHESWISRSNNTFRISYTNITFSKYRVGRKRIIKILRVKMHVLRSA